MTEGQVLFVRGEKSESRDRRTSEGDTSTAGDDIWDDTALVKAYDDAVDAAKEEIVRAMGLSKEDVSGNESSTSLTKKDLARLMRLGKKASGNESSTSDKPKGRYPRQCQGKWRVGDHCRAIYSGDGVVYEALITTMFYDKETCVVKYIGYGNEEEVPLKFLQPSQGPKARKKQNKAAAQEPPELLLPNGLEMECSEENSTKEPASKPKSGAVPKSPQGHKMDWEPQTVQPPGPGYFPSHFGSLPMGVPPMVVPPPPPPHLTSSCPEEDAGALSAMLMSWYMSGFHTGYYQGLKQAKNSPLASGGNFSRNSIRKK